MDTQSLPSNLYLFTTTAPYTFSASSFDAKNYHISQVVERTSEKNRNGFSKLLGWYDVFERVINTMAKGRRAEPLTFEMAEARYRQALETKSKTGLVVLVWMAKAHPGLEEQCRLVIPEIKEKYEMEPGSLIGAQYRLSWQLQYENQPPAFEGKPLSAALMLSVWDVGYESLRVEIGGAPSFSKISVRPQPESPPRSRAPSRVPPPLLAPPAPIMVPSAAPSPSPRTPILVARPYPWARPKTAQDADAAAPKAGPRRNLS
ncbi:hypothetical protein DL93DRAFT_2069626 [Clavulina sp. PMI_390]|nr:hypothetical protein DL93DRAFT_2069626 [Clavulina sp. PMI_390]